MRIGLQISSLKPYIQTREGVADTFRRVREMGYEHVQLQWTGEDVPCEFIAEQMQHNGFVCWGTQDYYDVVMARMDYEIRAAALYGSKYICLSGIPERFYSYEGVKLMAAEMKETCKRLADNGLIMTYHPRVREYVRFGGEPAALILLDSVPDMQFTLDAYHTEMVGLDTVGLMRKYAGGVDLVHIKDSSAKVQGAPLTPVGEGVLDFMPILAACDEAGVKAVFAEQETWQEDAFVCMERSLNYLRRASEQLDAK